MSTTYGTGDTYFTEVQRSITDFVIALPDGTHVEIVPFSGDYSGSAISMPDVASYDLTSPQIRNSAVYHVQGIVPDGTSTWITKAVGYALELLANRRTVGGQRSQTLLLFTDGGENDDDVLPFLNQVGIDIKAAKADADQSGSKLFVRYVTLGQGALLDTLTRQNLETAGVLIQDEPTGSAGVILEVRPALLAPSDGALGDLKQSTSLTATLCAATIGGTGNPVELALNLVPLSKQADYATLFLSPATLRADGTAQNFTLTLPAGTSLPPGHYALELSFSTKDPTIRITPARFTLSFDVSA